VSRRLRWVRLFKPFPAPAARPVLPSGRPGGL